MALSKREQIDLISAAFEGGVEEFAILFESFRPMLTAVASRLVGPHAGDDVVMETYLKAWRALRTFKGRSSLSTWLCRIVHNCALDFRRAEQRRSGRLVPDTDGVSPLERIEDPSSRSPQRQLEVRELGDLLKDAMAQLSEVHRTTIVLREVDGLSYGEIAAATGASIGTVMSRLFHARRMLRRILDRMES